MESPESLLLSLAGILVLGVGAQWLAWRVRLPSILLLLLAGVLVGPVGVGWLDPDALFGGLLPPVVSLSVAVILFEGGLSLELDELPAVRQVLLRLASVGAAITWLLAALLAHHLAGLPWGPSILLGSILTVTGPTVIGPLMRHVRPRGVVGPVAKWEGILVDVIGATLAVLVLEALLAAGVASSTAAVLGGLGMILLSAAGFGLLGTLLLAWPLKRRWIPDFLQSPVTLGMVLGIFSLADHVAHESGLLAVTVMGFLLANQRAVAVQHIVEFKENLRVLLISTLFIVLAARVTRADLAATSLGEVLFVVSLIVIVRPVSVLISTWRTATTVRERLFLACLAPRGIVAAAVSALFALRLDEHMARTAAEGASGPSRLAPVAFLVIVGTVSFYGLIASPLARRLGLSDLNPQGLLIVGGSRFARGIATVLASEGLRVLLVDTNRRNVADARLEGTPSVFGSILSEDVQERLDLGGIGKLLALTSNDEVNSLAAMHYRELFERGNVFQLSAGSEEHGDASPFRGRNLFSEKARFQELSRRVTSGFTVKRTRLSDEFDFPAFLAYNDGEAIPLFKLDKDGELSVFTASESPTAEPGEVLISLAPPDEDVPAPRARAESTELDGDTTKKADEEPRQPDKKPSLP